MRWIWAEDGSAIQAANVIRLFLDEGVLSPPGSRFLIKATVIGSSMPYVISRHPSVDDAREALKDLVVGREHRHGN